MRLVLALLFFTLVGHSAEWSVLNNILSPSAPANRVTIGGAVDDGNSFLTIKNKFGIYGNGYRTTFELSNQTANIAYGLPGVNAIGCLKNDGSGNLTWAACGSGGGGITIGDTVTDGTDGSILFVGTGASLAQNNAQLYWDNTTYQLAVGISTFAGTEKQRIVGTITTPAPNEPSNGLLTFNYGAGGGYSATGQSHQYHVYANKAVGNAQFYSPLFLDIGPTSDDSRTVAPGDPSSVSGTISYSPTGAYTAPNTSYSITAYGVVSRLAGTAYSTGSGASSGTSNPSFTIGNSSIVTGGITYGSGNYIANGDTWTLSVWAYADSPATATRVYSAANADGSPGADDGSTNPYYIDWSWAAVTGAVGYMLELNGPTGPYFYNIGAATSFTDDFTLWTAGGATHTPTSQDEPYNVDWNWTTGSNNDSWIATSGANYKICAGTGFTDNNTWDGTGFVASPNSIPEDYNVTVSWTDSTPADAFTTLVSLNGGAFDTYYVTTVSPLTDNNTALMPSPDINNTSYSDTALNATGDIIFKGKLLGSDQFVSDVLVIGDNVTNVAYPGPVVTVGRANSYSGYISDKVIVVGTNNATGNMNNTTLIGSSNTLTTNSVQTAVFGISNNLSSDAIYANTFGNGNVITARLTNVFGQGNSVGSPRATAIGTINTIGSSAEHAFTIGYNNQATASESGVIGYNSSASGQGATSIGSYSTATGALATAIGYSCTAGGNHSQAFGYGCSTSGTNSYAFGFLSGATATDSMALGIGAAATVSHTIALAAIESQSDVTTVNIQGYSSGTGATSQDMFRIAPYWQVSNNSSRRSGVVFSTFSTSTASEFFRAQESLGGSVSPFVRTAIGGAVEIDSPSVNDFGTRLKIYAGKVDERGLVIQGSASQTADLQRWQNSTPTILSKVDAAGNVGVRMGSTALTAYLQLAAGTTAASTAPLKFTSGSLQTTAEVGAVEFLTDKWYGTITSGASRKEFTLNDTNLTSAKFPVATANGRLEDSSLIVSSSTLTDGYSGGLNISVGQLSISTAGKGISIKEGTNAKMGQAVLVAGTVTVSTTAVTTSSRIFLTNQVSGGTVGLPVVGTITAGTSFVINSSSATDTSTINWMIVEGL